MSECPLNPAHQRRALTTKMSKLRGDGRVRKLASLVLVLALSLAFGATSFSGAATSSDTFSPDRFDFGDQDVGSESPTHGFGFTNRGKGSATLSASLTGGNRTQYVIKRDNCSGSIGPGKSCTITVAFKPSSAGRQAAAFIEVRTSNGPRAFSSALSGNGIGDTLTPSNANFGNQATTTTSNATNFTFTNNKGGATNLVVGISGTGGTQFAITSNNCSGSVGPGASCTISVAFKPTSPDRA